MFRLLTCCYKSRRYRLHLLKNRGHDFGEKAELTSTLRESLRQVQRIFEQHAEKSPVGISVRGMRHSGKKPYRRQSAILPASMRLFFLPGQICSYSSFVGLRSFPADFSISFRIASASSTSSNSAASSFVLGRARRALAGAKTRGSEGRAVKG